MPARPLPETVHRILAADARHLPDITDGSVHLVVTSPPYPMIEMWDEAFGALSPEARDALAARDGWRAFEAMHRVLDEAWKECARVLAPGGFLCINIGDATRSMGEDFAVYPNHARILTACLKLGLQPMPAVIWRKQTNAPNKFMGSGTLPAGAYVTLEHEFVLLLRKGGKRTFDTQDEKERRRASAYFWEERNRWFSDLWEFKGEKQDLGDPEVLRRSAAYPLELPYRLIAMYSLEGDTVLDPFAGTGTTSIAALALGRNSVGCELDASLVAVAKARLRGCATLARERSEQRLAAHLAFVEERKAQGKEMAHLNGPHGMPVVTGQETELRVLAAAGITDAGPQVNASYQVATLAPRTGADALAGLGGPNQPTDAQSQG